MGRPQIRPGARAWEQSELRFEEQDARGVCDIRPLSAPPGTPTAGRPFSGAGTCEVVAALWDRRLLSKVTGVRSQLHGVPRDRVTSGDRRGSPPTPPPDRRQEPPSPLGSLRRFGGKLAGGAEEAETPKKGLSRSDTPRLRTRLSPGPGSFGVQLGPPPRCTAVPGRGQLVGRTILPATLPQAPGRRPGPPRPHASRRGVSG